MPGSSATSKDNAGMSSQPRRDSEEFPRCTARLCRYITGDNPGRCSWTLAGTRRTYDETSLYTPLVGRGRGGVSCSHSSIHTRCLSKRSTGRLSSLAETGGLWPASRPGLPVVAQSEKRIRRLRNLNGIRLRRARCGFDSRCAGA